MMTRPSSRSRVHGTRADAGGGVAETVVLEDVDGLEQFSLLSAGIDIGTSTSNVTLSRLTVRRRGAALSAQCDVTERVTLYSSPILLTPYRGDSLIDAEGLTDFIGRSYDDAGVSPSQIDTGVLVVTGEALNRANARAIAESSSRDAGRFVCISAGPNHEAMLAAHGSGAVDLSSREQSTVMNVDVGGGTSKIAVIRSGEIVQTAAFSVGSRLIAFDEQGRIARLEQPARVMMESIGLHRAHGDVLSVTERRHLVKRMTDMLFTAMRAESCNALLSRLLLTEPIDVGNGLSSVDALIFSGGTSEFVYGRARRNYQDLGDLLGEEIGERLTEDDLVARLKHGKQTIRATVMGAGEYTVQASGMTSYISDTDQLPVRGLQVVTVPVRDGVDEFVAMRSALAQLDLDDYRRGLALALNYPRYPGYQELRSAAEAIHRLVRGQPTTPLFVLVNVDVAKSLGGILKEELRCPQTVVVVDGIDVGPLDHVDLGPPLGVSESLPITVKSLVFAAPDARHD